jgi:hypothetical protein
MKMATRFQFHRLAFDANERQTNSRDVEVLPIPTLDERVTLYLQALHGNRDFTEEESSNARNLLLNSMAGEIAAQVIPADQSLRAARETNAASTITYDYKGFKIIFGNSQSGHTLSIYQDGQLRSWASDLHAAVQWIDESTHGADGGGSFVSRPVKSAQPQEWAIEPEITELRPSYEAAQHWQSAQRKEAIGIAPIAGRRTSILAVGATLGLVLIVTGGTLGYRWTYPHMADEVTAPVEQARVPPPTTSPRSLSTGPVPDEVTAPAQQARVPPAPTTPTTLSTRSAPDKAAPEQHMLQIASRRGDAHVLNVFLRLKQEQPALFGQAAIKRVDAGLQTGVAGDPARRGGPLAYTAERAKELHGQLGSFTGQLGPFASEEDAAAACRALEAADIQCFGQREGR